MTITQQQAVKICPVNDAACGELPPSVRCAECKQSTAQPQAVVPALTNEQIAAGYLAMLSSIEVVGMDRAVQRFRDAVAAAQPSAQAERAPVQAGEFMPLHAGNGNRHGPLSAACDNVLAWRLGEACNAGAKASAGDLIDRGLVLLRELRERGFLVVQATDADRASSGATPADVRMLTGDEHEELENALGLAVYLSVARVIQQKFCEVNAGKRIPADGVIGGV